MGPLIVQNARLLGGKEKAFGSGKAERIGASLQKHACVCKARYSRAETLQSGYVAKKTIFNPVPARRRHFAELWRGRNESHVHTQSRESRAEIGGVLWREVGGVEDRDGARELGHWIRT